MSCVLRGRLTCGLREYELREYELHELRELHLYIRRPFFCVLSSSSSSCNLLYS